MDLEREAMTNQFRDPMAIMWFAICAMAGVMVAYAILLLFFS